jgi:HNH endonuclease
MRRVQQGDLVLHFYSQPWPDGTHESRLAGRSVVTGEARETHYEPPSPGDWHGMAPYYRIDLGSYESFPTPLPLRTLVRDYGDDIRGDLATTGPRFYPFNRWRDTVRTVQGIYLAEATPGFYSIIRRALGLEASDGNSATSDSQVDYAEARRLARERYYFARNASLVTAAKQRYGYGCMVCGFSFEVAYGEYGREYIECHHLNPLSERAEEEQLQSTATSVEDVAVVCANCHRMLHRRRPALTIDELRAVLGAPSPVGRR